MTPTIASPSRYAASVPGALAVALMVLTLHPGVGRSVFAQSPPPAAPAATPPAATAGAPAGSAVDYAKDRDAIFDAFYKTGLDTSTAYAVSNLPVKKDNMTLLLKQGTVFLMKPIAGEITGAVFLGDGEASMTPPNRMERYMLKKYSGAETLREPFSDAVFRFSDGTHKELIAAARPDSAGTPQAGRAGEIFKDRNEWLDGTRSFQLEMQFLESRISDLKGQDFFLADFHSTKHNWVTYIYNPQANHENFLASSETLGAKGRRYLLPWNVWHKQSDYDQNGHYVLLPDHEGPRVIRVTHNDMTLDLRNTKTVEWSAKTTVEPLMDNLRCLRFDLVNNAREENRWYDDSFWPARVISVSDDSGAPLPYMHKKDQLLVLLQSPGRAGRSVDLEVRGQADVIYQVTAESFGLLQAPWYPHYGYYGGRSSFHWTIRVPRPFLVTGSGKILRRFEDKERNQNGIETQSDLPVNFPWMIFGKFQIAERTVVLDESKKSVGLSINTVTINGEGTPAKKVEGFFDETQQILNLYEKVYGPYPYEELHIAQMGPDLGFGQGPPYFVQLTGDVFLSASTLGGDSVHNFLSHEIGHQWWGNQVGWASDDDWWLSEGFAEYAAAIFIQGLQKERGLQRLLDEWRKDAKIADAQAPIAAARTLIGPKYEGYAYSLLYSKAPYVLHMLRIQLDDEKYTQVMRSIQEAYKGRSISTEMVLAQINHVTGQDYTSFFDQWIWGTGIPTFRYTWRSEKQPDGKFLISVHVSQDDKVNLKKVLMPVYVHFKDKTIPQYKPVVQAEQDIKIMSPIDPKDVTLDDEHTLLAEIVKAS